MSAYLIGWKTDVVKHPLISWWNNKSNKAHDWIWLDAPKWLPKNICMSNWLNKLKIYCVQKHLDLRNGWSRMMKFWHEINFNLNLKLKKSTALMPKNAKNNNNNNHQALSVDLDRNQSKLKHVTLNASRNFYSDCFNIQIHLIVVLLCLVNNVCWS